MKQSNIYSKIYGRRSSRINKILDKAKEDQEIRDLSQKSNNQGMPERSNFGSYKDLLRTERAGSKPKSQLNHFYSNLEDSKVKLGVSSTRKVVKYSVDLTNEDARSHHSNKITRTKGTGKKKVKKGTHKRVRTGLPVQLLVSPYNMNKEISSDLLNLTDKYKVLSSLAKTPLKNKNSATIDLNRDRSFEGFSNSFNYPVHDTKVHKYSIGVPREGADDVYGFKKKGRTKSFVGSHNKSSHSKSKSVANPPKTSKHSRHRSDGPKLSNSNVSIKNSIKSRRSSKSKSKQKLGEMNRSLSKLMNTSDSNIISTIQIFQAKNRKYFGQKKSSVISDQGVSMSKRSPSIRFLKKKKAQLHTDVNNSPAMSSTESLDAPGKYKSKHTKAVKKLYGLNSEKSFTLLSSKNVESQKKGNFLKKKKKSLVTKYAMKPISFSKPSSPKIKRSPKYKKRSLKKGNLTRQVSKCIPIIGEDCELADSDNTQDHKFRAANSGINDETLAQTPSSFLAKKSSMMNRKVSELKAGSKQKSQSNFGIYKDANLKSKVHHGHHVFQKAQKYIDFNQIIDGPVDNKGFKKTEFVIPEHMKFEQPKPVNESLTKFLKESSNVQSHTIHISDLMNSSSKRASSIEKKKQLEFKKGVLAQNRVNLSKLSQSTSNVPHHKRVKSMSSMGAKGAISNKLNSGYSSKHDSMIKASGGVGSTKTSQANYQELQHFSDNMNYKKSNLYMMKKTKKKGLTKKPSIGSMKYTILKSKKSAHLLGKAKHHKFKSENVTPRKKNPHLYNYQYSLQSSPTHQGKTKITMNVSIDLSQNQKQTKVYNDKDNSTSQHSSRHHSIKQPHEATPIQEEEAEHEMTSFKYGSSKKNKSKSKNKSDRSKHYSGRKGSKRNKGSKSARKEESKFSARSGLSYNSGSHNSQSSNKKKYSGGIKNIVINNEIEQEYNQMGIQTPIKPIEVSIKENLHEAKLNKRKEENLVSDSNEMASYEGKAQNLPESQIDNSFPQLDGCVPSISPSGERLDTFETDLSALNLSPKSKAHMKLKKLIKRSFRKNGTAPDTTSEFYRIGKVLGRGAFGKVNLTIHRMADEMVAIKSLNKEFLTDETSKNKVMKEVRILKKDKAQKHLFSLYDTFETQKHIIFVMELCSGGDLLNYVRKRRKLSEDYGKAIFKQILEALHYCHKLNILHRDIKLDNIILDSEGEIKIGDFGVSKIINPKEIMFDQCGTPAYIAPEILRDKGYVGYGVDVWSSGVVLYAMLYGTVPFRAQNMNELHDMIIKAKYTLKQDISENARDLLKKILEPNPKKRLKIPEILKHPWFDDLKEDLEMFTDQEKEKIRDEFSYNQDRKNIDTEISCDFTEHHLETIENDDLRNLTTKSIILAPFNSTTSHVSSDIERGIEEMILDRKVFKFNAKCRDFNRQYEMNNNCELDNGVYNKFMCSSRASINFSPSQKDDELGSDGLSGGGSLEMSFDQNEKILKDCDEHDIDDQVEKELEEEKNRRDNGEISEFEKLTQNDESIFDVLHEKEVIDMNIVDEIVQYGYPEEFIVNSIENNEINYATASYYILKKRTHIENSHLHTNAKREIDFDQYS